MGAFPSFSAFSISVYFQARLLSGFARSAPVFLFKLPPPFVPRLSSVPLFPGRNKGDMCRSFAVFILFVPMELDLKRMNIHASIALSTFPLSSVKKEIPKYFSFSSVPAKNKLQYRRNVRTAMDVEVVLVSRFITFLYIPPRDG